MSLLSKLPTGAMGELVGQVGLAALRKFQANAGKRTARKLARQARKRQRRIDKGLPVPEITKIITPDGKVLERQEPTYKFNSSTKSHAVGAVAATIGYSIFANTPLFDSFDAFVTQVCAATPADGGPTRAIVMAVVPILFYAIPTFVMNRFTKTPSENSGKFVGYVAAETFKELPGTNDGAAK